jgi:hypothetical protein
MIRSKKVEATMGLLDEIQNEVASMDADQVREQLARLKEQKAKQVEYRKTKGSSPEAKAKRTEYNKARSQRDDVKEKMKEYRQRPETKEKQKAYRQERYARQKALLARAKELGIEV